MKEERYYLLEKNEHGGHSSKLWTLEELKAYFKPIEESEEAIREWGKIEKIEDLEYYIEDYVNYCYGMHEHDYYIEKY